MFIKSLCQMVILKLVSQPILIMSSEPNIQNDNKKMYADKNSKLKHGDIFFQLIRVLPLRMFTWQRWTDWTIILSADTKWLVSFQEKRKYDTNLKSKRMIEFHILQM